MDRCLLSDSSSRVQVPVFQPPSCRGVTYMVCHSDPSLRVGTLPCNSILLVEHLGGRRGAPSALLSPLWDTVVVSICLVERDRYPCTVWDLWPGQKGVAEPPGLTPRAALFLTAAPRWDFLGEVQANAPFPRWD